MSSNDKDAATSSPTSTITGTVLPPPPSSSASSMNRAALSLEADKRPLISNLVSSDDGNTDQVKRPVISTEAMGDKFAQDKLKIPQPPSMATMVPPSYYSHYPDYYQYYNLFSSYYQHQQPMQQPTAEMIHAYNSYLYQNYSAHPKAGFLQQQQQQSHHTATPPPPQQFPQQQQQQHSAVKQQHTNQILPAPHPQSYLDAPLLTSTQQHQSTQKQQKADIIDTSNTAPEEEDDFKSRHPTAIPKVVKKQTKLRSKKVVKPEIVKNSSASSSSTTSSSSSRPFPCSHENCSWSFARLSDLKRHMKSHQPPQFQCPYWRNDPTCHRNGGAFNRLDVLKRHLKLVHYVQDRAAYPPKAKSEQGWCRSCQNQFDNVKDFLTHVEECSSKLNPTEWKQHYDSSNIKEKDGTSSYFNIGNTGDDST